MKKIILSAIAICAFTVANAQDAKDSSEGFAKGDLFVTGSVGFGSDKTGDEKISSFNFSPRLGYFVSENIAIGAELSFGSETDDDGAGTEVKTNSFNGGVFGRYYFTPSAKFSPFANLGLGFGSNKVTTDIASGGINTSFEAKEKTFNVGLGIGFNYFLSPKWALETSWAGLNFDSNDNGGDGDEKTNSFGLNANLSSINFGVLYKF